MKARKRKETRRGGRISKRYDDNDEDRIKVPTNNWLADKSVGKIAGEERQANRGLTRFNGFYEAVAFSVNIILSRTSLARVPLCIIHTMRDA